MKGLKIRTMSIPAHMEIVKRLGANATPISWAELYTALETGVVDGQENSIPTIIEGSVHEVQKYVILDNHVYTQMHNMVNDEWFNSLPETYKIIIQTAGEKSATAAATKMRAKRIYGLNFIKKYMKIYDPSMEEVAEFRKLTQKPVLSFIKAKLKDPAWIDKILKAAKDANKRLGYQ
jgi:TRAP-type C4-dicarboxylate transport system substrate-binding protein